MLDVTLLGTGGMMPLPKRFLTSLYVRYKGCGILIDCGEGTQIAMRRRGLSGHNINTILLTHFHADHISGLPGFLLTLGNGERREPVTIIGPKGLDRVMQAVRVFAPELPFPVEIRELRESGESFLFDEMQVDAFRVNHNVTCYGYAISVKRQGRFDDKKAKALEIPLEFWSRLQKGEVISENGMTYTPDMVLGNPRKGLRLVYATDTRPTDSIAEAAKGADLAILEGMYGEAEKLENAIANRHMTMQEAAQIAKCADPGELWLTHYSPACVHPEMFEEEICGIFPRTVFPRDGHTKELMFEEE